MPREWVYQILVLGAGYAFLAFSAGVAIGAYAGRLAGWRSGWQAGYDAGERTGPYRTPDGRPR